MRKTKLTTFSLACFASTIFLFGLQSSKGQDCYLSVFVTEVASTSKFESELFSSFSSTLINQETQKAYKAERSGQYVHYKNITSGEYKITITSSGYKTSVRTHSFVCNGTSPFNYIDILMYPGNENQFVYESDSSRLPPKKEGRANSDVKKETGIISKTPKSMSLFPEVLNGGIINGKALSMPRPEYPAFARSVRASGLVYVKVLIDEDGNVISAKAVKGHPLLLATAVAAARAAKFSPTALDGKLLRVSGVLSYYFSL